jgi:hypothetical protein
MMGLDEERPARQQATNPRVHTKSRCVVSRHLESLAIVLVQQGLDMG